MLNTIIKQTIIETDSSYNQFHPYKWQKGSGKNWTEPKTAPRFYFFLAYTEPKPTDFSAWITAL